MKSLQSQFVDTVRKEALKSDEFQRLVMNMKKGNTFPLRTKNKSEKPDTPWHCTFCGAQFNSIGGVLEHENVVTCMKCARTFCKEKCAKRSMPSLTYHPEETTQSVSNDDSRRSSYSATERWICKKCQPDSWINGIVRLLQFNETKEWYTKKMTTEQAKLNAELSALQRKEREQVRDFIERLVEALLGGELDNVSVKKIYKDERYDAIYMRYHGDLSSALTDLGSALHITISNLPIAGETPCAAHTSLKTIIQRFIREAAELPQLRKTQDEDHADTPDDTNDRTYEDLLSTAIINKVVQNYQENPPSIAGSSSTKSKRSVNDKEYFLGERNLDSASKFDDTSSLSSLDDYINTNGSTKYLDQMNFAIQQSIKEVSSSDDEADEVDYNIDELDSHTTRNNDWQENWYLRKRNFGSGTNSPVPVPMLVPNPNPTENAKVLIGDREIDETSDLSDANSDFEDSAEPSSLNAVLLSSKNLIGGTNPLVSLVARAESIVDDDVDGDHQIIEQQTKVLIHEQPKNLIDIEFTSDDYVGNEDNPNNQENQQEKIVETCNQAFILDPHYEDFGACGDVEDQLISLESNTEKDLEYTEKYATLPRKIPMPTPRQSKLSDIDFSKTSLLIEDSKTDNGDSGVTSDEDDKQKIFKGSSYGEREKDKWNHAVDLPNNPYSKSNLESRLSNRSNRSSSISSLNSLEQLPDTDVTPVTEAVDTLDHFQVNSTQSLIDIKVPAEAPPPLPKAPLPEMSKSLFDVLNDDRKGYQHRYGKDYFAKAAGRPQGALKKDWMEDDDDLHSRNGDIADDEERKVEVVDDPIVPQENIFRAIPVHIDDDDAETEQQLESSQSNKIIEDLIDEQSSIENNTPTKRLQPWDLSSDSDYSIERTYNVNSGKIIKKLGDVEYEVPVAEVPSAEGLKYTKLDENQNDLNTKTPKLTEVHQKRSHFLRSLTLEDEDIFTHVDNVAEDEVTAPSVNHFKLVNDIANETVEQYKVEPISPPAEYKTDDANIPKSIEYESEEKSCDFSIESTFEEEERFKIRQNENNETTIEIIEESLNRGFVEPEPTLEIDNTSNLTSNLDDVIEESINSGLIDDGHKQNKLDCLQQELQPTQSYEVIEESINRGILDPVDLFPVKVENITTIDSQSNDCDETELIIESLNRGIIEPKENDVVNVNNIVDLNNSINTDEDDDDEIVTSHSLNKLTNNDRSITEQIEQTAFDNLISSNHFERTNMTPEPDIEELKEKHLVKNLLGAFSKSFPNLSSTNKETPKPLQRGDMMSLSSDFIENSIEIEESEEPVPSVRNLKKKFERESDIKKDVEVHSSLTARSVPKQMRQQLAEANYEEIPQRHSMLSEVSNNTLDQLDVDQSINSIDSLDNVVVVDVPIQEQEEVILSFPKARSRIAFFERMSLK